MRFDSLLLPAFAAAVFACGAMEGRDGAASAKSEIRASKTEGDAPDVASAPATTDLLAGGTLDAWHKYGGGDVGEAWSVSEDGVLHFDASDKTDGRVNGGGDIVTDEDFGDYELTLEWKIAPGGNSGIIYNVVEEDGLDYPWLTGPEMQVLDNERHPDAKIYKHKAGDLYDLVSASDSLAVRPAGEWNEARLVNRAGAVAHYLNGVKLVEYDNTGDGWREMIAGSKFKDMPRFGEATEGKIALQDHGDEVWYRNIEVRAL